MRTAAVTLVTLLLPVTSALALERAAPGPETVQKLEVSLLLDQGDGEVLASGSEVSFSVRANQDAYVILYNIDVEGRVHLLFPESADRLERLPAGRILGIPASGPGWKAGSETGMEFVQAIATTRKDLIEESELYFLETGESPRILDDPFVAMNIMTDKLVRAPARNREVALDYTFFYVNERVSHPRTVCPVYREKGGVGDHDPAACEDYTIRAVDLYQTSFPYEPGFEVLPRNYEGSSGYTYQGGLDEYRLSTDVDTEPAYRSEGVTNVYVGYGAGAYPLWYGSGWGIHYARYWDPIWWDAWWWDPWFCLAYRPYPSYHFSWYWQYYPHYSYYAYDPYYCDPFFFHYRTGHDYYGHGKVRYRTSLADVTRYKKGGFRYQTRYATAASRSAVKQRSVSRAQRGLKADRTRAASRVATTRTRTFDRRLTAKRTRLDRSATRTPASYRTRSVPRTRPTTRAAFESRRNLKSRQFRDRERSVRSQPRTSLRRYGSSLGRRGYETRGRPGLQRWNYGNRSRSRAPAPTLRWNRGTRRGSPDRSRSLFRSLRPERRSTSSRGTRLRSSRGASRPAPRSRAGSRSRSRGGSKKKK
jgi:hypothetical protein